MKTLRLSDDLKLPLDAVTQTLAFLAKRGAGKTYAASKLAEEMFDAGAQFIVLDPVGSWYALRRGADGKSAGLAVPVLGGLHGDVPLEATSGPLVAALLVDRGTSAVLDVSMMRKGDRKRFAAEFAESFFEAKKRRKSAVHLFIEEAQVFVPQRVMPDEARMLGAFEDIVKLGRNFGIGATLISQRPQSVNKDALNQTECLVVLQTSGAQERKALREWIVDQGLDVGELIDTLPSLQRGEAWVWSPSWLGITKRVRIAAKRTFNASATPELGRVVDAKPLAPIDLEQLRTAMAEVVAKAQADDPKALKKRVAELEQQLAAKPAVKAETKVVEKPVLTDAQLSQMNEALNQVSDVQEQLQVVVHQFQSAVDPVRSALLTLVKGSTTARDNGVQHRRTPIESRFGRTIAAASATFGALSRGDVESNLGRCERALLGALGLRHPRPLSRDQLAILSAYSSTSSSFANGLGKLRSLALVQTDASGLTRLTAAGEGEAADSIGQAPASPEATREMWRSKLGKAERAMFDALVACAPNELSKAELSERSGYSQTSSSFANALGKLRTLALAENVDGGVRASIDLFGGAA